MSRVWDWLTGQEQARQRVAAELARQRAREAQDAALARDLKEAAQKQPKDIQRVKNEPRPGERLMPDEVERQRQMHDYPVEKPDPVPTVVRVATRLEYTMTFQPGPSLNGPGPTQWKNIRVKQPTVADKLLEAGRIHRVKENLQPDAGPDPGHDIDAFREPGSNPLFPDYSKGLQLKLPSSKKPGEDDQQ